jgi:hypothetical protein
MEQVLGFGIVSKSHQIVPASCYKPGAIHFGKVTQLVWALLMAVSATKRLKPGGRNG